MKILREPLLHFLVIGAALFGAFHFADGDTSPASDEIVVSSGQIGSLAAIFSRTWQRPPTARELDALVDEHIRDEVLYRHGVAMGLDRDDAVVRRRIRQKMEFVADLAGEVEPTDAELQAFVADRSEWFRSEGRVSFEHIYFRAGGAGVPEGEGLKRLLQDLDAGTVEAASLGSPLMAGAEFHDVSKSAVVRTFGEEFATRLDETPTGRWSGMVGSAYGAHLVRVTGRVEEREPRLEEVREAARREWLHARKVAANEALYERLRANYVVTVEDAPAGLLADRRAEVAP